MQFIKTFSEEPKDFYVYMHVKCSDGVPFYVGKGKNKRYSNHFDRNVFWKRTAKKYGVKVIIYRDGLQEWAAFELEQDIIALHGRRNIGTGSLCNLSDGGEGQSGYIPSHESNKKRSEKLKGRVLSESHKKKIGDKNRRRKLTEDTKKKLSDSRKGRFAGENHPLFGVKKSKESIEKTVASLRKKIRCIETGEIFKSVTDAAKSVNGTTSPISKVCMGNKKSYKSFTWEYFLEHNVESVA